MLDLAFQPDRDAGPPIYAQLADYLRGLIRTGRLSPGEKLPATRELARTLGIGRNTAAQAYQSLVDDGALLAHVGQGTFVSSRAAASSPFPAAPVAPRAFAWEGLFSRAARQPLPRGLAPPAESQIRFDFRPGRVDPSLLPRSQLRRAYRSVIGDTLDEVANLPHPQGLPRLRGEIARLLLSRGIVCDAEDVLVTAGAQQAVDLLARVLLDPGDALAMENPGYPVAAFALRSAGAHLVGIDVDGEGLRTDQLGRALRTHRLKAIHTTPAAQLPTGVVLSEARRTALLELADETQTPIIEDDYDSEFRHADSAPPALKTRDRAGQVIYVGTFSKALFPGLRLGYVVAARSLLDRLAIAQARSTFGVDAVAQAAVGELMANGAFERHVLRLRRRYAARRTAMVEALSEGMPEGTQWNESGGGLQLWITLPEGVSGADVRETALDRGIAYGSGESFHLGAGGESALALAFGNQPPHVVREGVSELAAIARAAACTAAAASRGRRTA